MAFLEEIPIYWKIWDWIVDCVIVVDICLTILTAVRDDNHRVIDDPRKIFIIYLKSWLLLDILCVFPFELVISPIEGEDIQSFWDIFKLTKLYRLIRVVRIIKMILKAKKNKYMLKLQDFLNITHGMLRLVQVLIIMSMCCNTIACLWFYQAKLRSFHPSTWVYQ